MKSIHKELGEPIPVDKHFSAQFYAELWGVSRDTVVRFVRQALEYVPLPKGAAADCKYFFWSGAGSRDGHIKTVDRTLQAVFRESGVDNAHAHRFRHTLATEILAKGGTIEDAPNILGDSPATIEQHYAKWSRAYQARTVEVLQKVHGTLPAHSENLAVSCLLSKFPMVLEVGVEPTCSVKNAGF